MQEALVAAALRMALAQRRVRPGLIHHTVPASGSPGGQYAAVGYRHTLARARMLPSMSRAENCYDNAFMESCFGSIKTELEMKPYPNARIAHKEIPAYIRYYNTRRRHSSLGYLTPVALEAKGGS
jgi:transposase InsO family protein